MGKQKRKSKARGFFWWLIMLIAVGVFSFSAYKLITIWLEYRQGTEEYNDLQGFVLSEAATATTSEDESTDEGVEAEDPGPKIDFEELKKVNQDIIGWLQVEDIPDINYPIVQGKDNDYYLHRTVKGTYNFAGSIFLEHTNKPDFSDPHSIIFGHNMKNGSMFGKLKNFGSGDFANAKHYFWVCTPDRNYKYEVFSVQEVISGGEAYTLFSGPGPEVAEYIEKMKGQSSVTMPDIAFDENSKVVTLSTCTTNTIKRLIIQGILVN